MTTTTPLRTTHLLTDLRAAAGDTRRILLFGVTPTDRPGAQTVRAALRHNRGMLLGATGLAVGVATFAPWTVAVAAPAGVLLAYAAVILALCVASVHRTCGAAAWRYVSPVHVLGATPGSDDVSLLTLASTTTTLESLDEDCRVLATSEVAQARTLTLRCPAHLAADLTGLSGTYSAYRLAGSDSTTHVSLAVGDLLLESPLRY